MEVGPISIVTPQETETMTIDLNENRYIFKIIKEEDYITLNILEKDIFPNTTYIKKLSFKEIKELHKLFYMLNSLNEFLEYIKSANENKKLTIKKDKNKIIINISVEYLFKQQIIEIPLLEQNINLKEFSKEIGNEISLLKDKIKQLEKNLFDFKDNNNIKILFDKQNKEIMDLKEDNKQLKQDIKELKSIIEKQNKENNNLKEEIKNIKQNYEQLKENINIKIQNEIKNLEITKNKGIGDTICVNSVIMKNEEFDMIKEAIESRINKKVKGVKKLYQATVDGGESIIFHKKCDNIPNTLTIIESEGKRRFGGFTSNIWVSNLIIYKDDKNAFLFSLDKKKIYSYKKDGYAIFCWSECGPSFGHNKSSLCTLSIYDNPIKEKNLYTYESDSNSYDFYGDNNGLSEDGKGDYIYAKDYEVFEIIFL